MAISAKQNEIDKMKWFKSIDIGTDACGTFDFCSKCDKNLSNPCEQAYDKFNAKTEEKAAPVKKAVSRAAKAPAKKEAAATVAPLEKKAEKVACKKVEKAETVEKTACKKEDSCFKTACNKAAAKAPAKKPVAKKTK